MPEYIWEIGSSVWFYYKEICCSARSHEHKIHLFISYIQPNDRLIIAETYTRSCFQNFVYAAVFDGGVFGFSVIVAQKYESPQNLILIMP
jgi:hypothetical protein